MFKLKKSINLFEVYFASYWLIHSTELYTQETKIGRGRYIVDVTRSVSREGGLLANPMPSNEGIGKETKGEHRKNLPSLQKTWEADHLESARGGEARQRAWLPTLLPRPRPPPRGYGGRRLPGGSSCEEGWRPSMSTSSLVPPRRSLERAEHGGGFARVRFLRDTTDEST